METLTFMHPTWIKVLGWVFLPFMLGISLFVIGIPIIYGRYELLGFVASFFLGGFCLYMTVNGLLTLPFMNATITTSDKGIRIDGTSDPRTINWSRVGRLKHVYSAQVLHLYDKDGNRILSVSENLKGYSLFVTLLNEKSNNPDK